jgi:hypothetical protein
MCNMAAVFRELSDLGGDRMAWPVDSQADQVHYFAL